MYAPWLKSNVAHLGVIGKPVVLRSVLAGAALLSRGEARRHVQGHVRGGEGDGSSWWEQDLEWGEFGGEIVRFMKKPCLDRCRRLHLTYHLAAAAEAAEGGVEDAAAKVGHHGRGEGGSGGRQWVGGRGMILAEANGARHGVCVGQRLMRMRATGDAGAGAGAGDG